ncbi:TfoX/Sxy family protein [Alphaproteobacteria bacterium KMM 3653]|uniref:TfoX/Sxy family protein n=1 Tax=Harenicola maris TaxID=2841044 RepID=A0AAP2CP70_9RHOB|nr:TfoX/Sxy family protein [Harenicola maris]
MAYDAGMAETMREDIGEQIGLSTRKMFGGLCFMLRGHMLCGVLKTGAMYRIGKDRHAKALALPGTRPMAFTGRLMGGFVELPADDFADDEIRQALTMLCFENVQSLPERG